MMTGSQGLLGRGPNDPPVQPMGNNESINKMRQVFPHNEPKPEKYSSAIYRCPLCGYEGIFQCTDEQVKSFCEKARKNVILTKVKFEK
jgi:hypothetical protein